MDERPAQALLQTPIDGHAMNSGCPLQAAVLLVAGGRPTEWCKS